MVAKGRILLFPDGDLQNIIITNVLHRAFPSIVKRVIQRNLQQYN